jgi:two-component system, OmpR family, phosphate regulon sensor histidine kinase PhoR
MRRRLFWRLYASYLVVVVLCAGAVGLYAARTAQTLYLDQAETDLEARAQLAAARVLPMLETADSGQLQATLKALDEASGTRITVIGQDGRVLGESEEDPATMPNHDTPEHPEVQTALGGGTGRSVRYSTTKREDMMYVAMPFQAVGGTVVVRTAVPLTTIDHALSGAYWRVAAITIAVALITAFMGLFVAGRISGQMRRIQYGAVRFAGGDFSHKVPVPTTEEFAGVATSLNSMADQLAETIADITHQRNEREAMLASMVEGVFAVDLEARIITMNDAAARLLGRPGDVVGRSIEEVVRTTDLQRFVADALVSDEPVEAEIALRSSDSRYDRFLQAHGARLRDESGTTGAVVVLNDVTRLKRLETVRRDFVANVSHELRTPVTSIKGFAETLLDGALAEPHDAERFVRIIAAQADRLNAIIEDLLSLSRLEQESEGAAPSLEHGPVCDVLQLAVEACGPTAASRGVTLDLTCRPGLTAAMDPPLLERAVVNLIDNAIKYSEPGSRVEIGALEAEDEVTIEVRDHGAGIERRHLPRLFERFYRSDQARSRDQGGTGLGLAIVKHVAQLHDGTVSVDSTPGLGSTFRIHLPA